MIPYWFSVLAHAIVDSVHAAGHSRTTIVYGACVAIVEGILAWRDTRQAGETWQMLFRKHLPRELKRLLVIVIIAWLPFFYWYWFEEPYTFQVAANGDRDKAKLDLTMTQSQLSECSQNLLAINSRAGEIQTQRDSLQSTFDAQQSTVNTCVVALAKSSATEPLHVDVWTIGLRVNKPPPVVTEIVLITNKRTVVRGDLECDHPFNIFDWTLASGGARMNVGATPKAPNDWYLLTTSPLWEPQIPVVVNVTSNEGLGECKFVPRN